MFDKITRRHLLSATTAAGLAAACSGPDNGEHLSARTQTQSGVFKSGIAAGDPRMDSLVIWTHISPVDMRQSAVPVQWSLSLNSDMSEPVITQSGQARQANDWTFKAVPTGLTPGQTYYYQFTSEGGISPIGQARTLPDGDIEQIRLAVVSCANWQQGFFNVYDHISRQDGFDALIHLGDYFYEYGTDQANAAMEKAGRLHQPPHEVLTLEDYRIRHAQYRSDPNLQALTAKTALIPIWDDHESSNDSWTGGAENHQEGEGTWQDRKQAALRAYFEWMPVRPPKEGRPAAAFYRDYKWGNLLRLVVWETRLFARGEPVLIEDHAELLQQEGGKKRFTDKILNDPARDMLGQIQQDYVVSALKSSKDQGENWRMIANQVVLGKLTTPDLAPYVSEEIIANIEKQWPPIRQIVSLSKYRLPVYPDSWDGYPTARESLYSALDDAGVNDLLVVTGDAHEYWANMLTKDDGTAMGVELGTSSVSSETLKSFMGDGVKDYALLITRSNPDVRYYNAETCGYIDLTLTAQKGRARFIAIDRTDSTDYAAFEAAAFDIRKNNNSLKFDNPKGLDVKQRLLFNGLG